MNANNKLHRRSNQLQRNHGNNAQIECSKAHGIIEKETIKEIVSQSMSLEVSHFSGPLPSPEVLIKFKDVSPDFPERILIMAEKQQTHEHQVKCEIIKMEKQKDENEYSLIARGQYFALTIGLSGIISTCYLAELGAYTTAFCIGGTTIVTLVGSFLGFKKQAENSTNTKILNHNNDKDTRQ